jgi:hypothetical protein
MIDQARITAEIKCLHTWAFERGYRYTSLNTVPEIGWVDWLCRRSRILGIAWRQFFRLSPVDLRPLFGPQQVRADPQSLILFALAYVHLSRVDHDPQIVACRDRLLSEVLALRSSCKRGFAIRQNNRLYMQAYEAKEDDVSPLWTAWAGHLFLAADRYIRNAGYREHARQVASYFLEEHPREETPEGVYFYYDPSISDRIYNASAQISSFLVQFGRVADDTHAQDAGASGLRYVLAHQNADGSWFQGFEPRFRYTDNFHTAFVLQALASAEDHLDCPELSNALSRGLEYFTHRLFKKTSNGLQPIHFDPRFLPRNSTLIQSVDLRDVAVSVLLFLDVARRGVEFPNKATRLLMWALRRMKADRCTFCPEATFFWKNRIPYIEFQAWMMYCLTRYLTSALT